MITTKSIFEKNIKFLNLTIPLRFLTTFLIVSLAKVLGSLLLCNYLNIQFSDTYWMDIRRVPDWEQNTVFILNLDQTPRWQYLFVGWDSAWHLSIMTRGYFSNQAYAFFPGFSIFGNAFRIALGNPISSIVWCAAIFGVLLVPFYQLVAENYMDRKAAFGSTILFTLSPYVFLFTTIAYSEGLFLFFTLSAWYCFKRQKALLAAAFASIATIIRPVGFLMALPMLIGYLRDRGTARLRQIVLGAVPLLSLFIWLLYCRLTANDWLAPMHTSNWNDYASFPIFVSRILPRDGIKAFWNPLPNQQHWFSISVWIALVVVPFLIWRLWSVDKPLATYSLVYYIAILTIGGLMAFPRYISILYPIWIPITSRLFRTKRFIVLVTLISVLSYLVGLDLWIDFLNGQFIA